MMLRRPPRLGQVHRANMLQQNSFLADLHIFQACNPNIVCAMQLQNTFHWCNSHSFAKPNYPQSAPANMACIHLLCRGSRNPSCIDGIACSQGSPKKSRQHMQRNSLVYGTYPVCKARMSPDSQTSPALCHTYKHLWWGWASNLTCLRRKAYIDDFRQQI